MVRYNVGAGLGGAAQGAQLGSAGGPVGMGVGGALGALMGFFGGGSKEKMKKLPTMTKEQLGLLNQMISGLGPGGQLGGLYQQGLGGLSDFLDPSSEAMQRFADPYMRTFEQETVPGLAERFAGAGPMGGALSSSGFGQSLSAAAGNLQSQLASMKTGLQRQAIGDIMSHYQLMSGTGLGAEPFAYGRQQAEPGFLGNWAQSGFPGASQAIGGLGQAWQNHGPVMGNV